MAGSGYSMPEKPVSPAAGAVVLAAGLSRRMGMPKMLLPWAETTVIGQVVNTLLRANLGEILIISGKLRTEIEAAVRGFPVRVVYNRDFANGEMLSSLKTGLTHLSEDTEAALVVLGDQPQIEPGVVQAVLQAFREQPGSLVVPSYNLRRGHPWLLPRGMWHEMLRWSSPATPRDFLNARKEKICFLPVNTASILMDLDTPEDYQRQKPA